MNYINFVTRKIYSAYNYVSTFLKWVLIASITGTAGGFIGSAFSIGISYANKINNSYRWVIMLMPLGGLLIVKLYKLAKIDEDPGTNLVINSIRTQQKVPWVMAPLIFVSTVITHLVGGSAGREGAALQLGGSLGALIGRIIRLDNKDTHIVVMCGMSGLFSSLFCTPVTAAIFALEVISVGVTYYSALVPCFISAAISYFIAISLGISPLKFNIEKFIPEFNPITVLQVIGLAAACAVISIIFCVVMKQTHIYAKRLFNSDYVRVLAGSTLLLTFTLLAGCRDYNGAGSQIIADAIGGIAKPEAFAVKILFTAVTISCGFKGGEIVPTIFIGSTFGCVVAPLLGMNASFGAAIGFICLFCGVVNCPFASILLSVEVFGAGGLIFFAIGTGVSYMLSGYYGLYSSQKILYSKLKTEYININAK